MNLVAIKEAALLVANLLPVIIDIVKTLENAVSRSGVGNEKLSSLRAILEVIYSISPGSQTFDEVWPIINKVVNTIVTLFNNIGWNK